MSNRREVRDDQHGTTTGYQYGCRCRPCRKARSEYAAANLERHAANEAAYRERQRQAAYANNATRDEVRQWAAGLGFYVPPNMTGRAAEALVARFNREHPDRPYVRGGAS